MKERLFRAYWTEGRRLGRMKTSWSLRAKSGWTARPPVRH
jgi:hypothetical protein